LAPKSETRRKFRHLSTFERAIVLEALLGLIVTRVGLRLFGFRRWKNGLSRLARPRPAPEISFSKAREIARMVTATARHLFIATNCLDQSLVLWWLLRRRGIAAELRFGARKEAGPFDAHSWVELDGRVLSDTGEVDLQFVPFEGPFALRKTRIP